VHSTDGRAHLQALAEQRVSVRPQLTVTNATGAIMRFLTPEHDGTEPRPTLPESTESLARRYGFAYLRLFARQSEATVELFIGEAAIASG
jgi:hypothetical protein